jgi:hypothetical protein
MVKVHRVTPLPAAPDGGQRRVLGRALEGARGDSIQLTDDSVLDCVRNPQPHPEPC